MEAPTLKRDNIKTWYIPFWCPVGPPLAKCHPSKKSWISPCLETQPRLLDDVHMKGQTTIVRGSVVQQFERFNPKVAQTSKKHLNLFFEWSKWNQHILSTKIHLIKSQTSALIVTFYLSETSQAFIEIWQKARDIYYITINIYALWSLAFPKVALCFTHCKSTSNKLAQRFRRFLKHFKISNPKTLGIPTPSLSKSKQSIQFTRFLLFTSVWIVVVFVSTKKKTAGSGFQKGGFQTESLFPGVPFAAWGGSKSLWKHFLDEKKHGRWAEKVGANCLYVCKNACFAFLFCRCFANRCWWQWVI